MSLATTLKSRIKMLQLQIDEAKQSDETHNCFGVPMLEQITDWEELIIEAKEELDTK